MGNNTIKMHINGSINVLEKSPRKWAITLSHIPHVQPACVLEKSTRKWAITVVEIFISYSIIVLEKSPRKWAITVFVLIAAEV